MLEIRYGGWPDQAYPFPFLLFPPCLGIVASPESWVLEFPLGQPRVPPSM